MARGKKAMQVTVIDPVGESEVGLATDSPRTDSEMGIVNLPTELVQEYVSFGFRASEAEGYERDIEAVHAGMAASVVGFVDAGERLASMKERTGHGSWSFLLGRVGIEDRTATRCIAAYNAVQTHPELAPLMGRFGTTTLALLGERKDLTPAAMAEIVQLAEAGEATQELVLDEIRKHAPKKEKKSTKEKSYFASMSLAQSEAYSEELISYLSAVAGKMLNAGAKMESLGKSKGAKSYINAILKGGTALSPLQQALRGALLSGYIIDHPAPPPTPAE